MLQLNFSYELNEKERLFHLVSKMEKERFQNYSENGESEKHFINCESPITVTAWVQGLVRAQQGRAIARLEPTLRGL